MNAINEWARAKEDVEEEEEEPPWCPLTLKDLRRFKPECGTFPLLSELVGATKKLGRKRKKTEAIQHELNGALAVLGWFRDLLDHIRDEPNVFIIRLANLEYHECRLCACDGELTELMVISPESDWVHANHRRYEALIREACVAYGTGSIRMSLARELRRMAPHEDGEDWGDVISRSDAEALTALLKRSSVQT